MKDDNMQRQMAYNALDRINTRLQSFRDVQPKEGEVMFYSDDKESFFVEFLEKLGGVYWCKHARTDERMYLLPKYLHLIAGFDTEGT